MTSENSKVAKIGKDFISNWTDSKRIFGTGQVVHSLICPGRAQYIRFSSNGWRFILMWQWNSL